MHLLRLRFEPLPEGSLRTKIEALAGRLSFPLKKLYSIDGSKRSAHSNGEEVPPLGLMFVTEGIRRC